MNTAIILCGGFSTRLKPLTNDTPKPFLYMGDKMFIQRQMDILIDQLGLSQFVLSMHYLYDQGIDRLGFTYRGRLIRYVVEKEPLGTGGGIRYALEELQDKNVIVMNGDVIIDANLTNPMELYYSRNADAVITSVYKENCARFGSIEDDGDGRITRFVEKDPNSTSKWINAGIYFLNRDKFMRTTIKGAPFSIETQWFPRVAKMGNSYIYKAKSYWNDVGTLQTWIDAYDYYKIPPDHNYNMAKMYLKF